MTRKHYVALAAALAWTRPDAEDYTTTSAVGDNTFYNGIAHKAALATWKATRNEIADVLAADNYRFDRERFNSATE